MIAALLWAILSVVYNPRSGGGGGGGAPTGPAGGDLAGEYPNPTIGEGKVTEAKLGAQAVSTAKIKLLAITEALLGAEAVSAAKIAGEAVTETKLGAGAVTAAKLGAEAVETGKIKLLAITEGLLAAEAVGEGKIKNLAVGTGKIAANAVTAAKLGAEAVEATAIKNLTITAAKIAEATITGAKIVAGTITDNLLAKPVITGVVKANGEKEVGEGFAVEKLSAGTYKITLTAELATLAGITVTVLGANNYGRGAAASKKVFEVFTLVPNTNLVADSAFTFMIKAS